MNNNGNRPLRSASPAEAFIARAPEMDEISPHDQCVVSGGNPFVAIGVGIAVGVAVGASNAAVSNVVSNWNDFKKGFKEGFAFATA